MKNKAKPAAATAGGVAGGGGAAPQGRPRTNPGAARAEFMDALIMLKDEGMRAAGARPAQRIAQREYHERVRLGEWHQ